MKTIANIINDNIECLKNARDITGVDFEVGTSMSFSEVNNNISSKFRPIFCESFELGETLLQEYLLLAIKFGLSLEEDQYFLKSINLIRTNLLRKISIPPIST